MPRFRPIIRGVAVNTAKVTPMMDIPNMDHSGRLRPEMNLIAVSVMAKANIK
jgi:hypothetical protein